LYAGAAGLTCLSEVPLPRLPATGDILGEGEAISKQGALEELMGDPSELDTSPAAARTSASPTHDD
jgi:hypothetical protein